MQLPKPTIRAAGVVWILIMRCGFVRMIEFGPSILQTHGDDEDIYVGSGHDFGSGSGYLDLERFTDSGSDDDEEEEVPVTRSPVMKLITPESSRISCVVCNSKSDPSCRNPYKRNESHIQPCQASVGGCLEVIAPSGDTYRNCLYGGIFPTAENTDGCHKIKEENDVGHKFVNTSSVIICICRTSECNGYNNPHRKDAGTIPYVRSPSGIRTSKPFTSDPSLFLRARSETLGPPVSVSLVTATVPLSYVTTTVPVSHVTTTVLVSHVTATLPTSAAPAERAAPKSTSPFTTSPSSQGAPLSTGSKVTHFGLTWILPAFIGITLLL